MTKSITPEIEADIILLTTEEGGRQNAIPHGEYRGVISAGVENFSFRTFIKNTNGIKASIAQSIEIQFLFPEIALPNFPVGAKFTVWEGKIIGHGQVTKVVTHA